MYESCIWVYMCVYVCVDMYVRQGATQGVYTCKK
jgi:hypothetical protein